MHRIRIRLIDCYMTDNFSVERDRIPGAALVMAVARYWNERSIYAPFFFLILFLVLGWSSGSLYVTFGPNADIGHRQTSAGQFLPHPSVSVPYKFQKSTGDIITLNCKPRMKKSYCVDTRSLPPGNVYISFAPYNQSALNSVNGVIIGIEHDGRVLFASRLSKDSPEYNQSGFDLSYWTSRPFLIVAGLAPMSVLVFICCGVYISVRRLFCC